MVRLLQYYSRYQGVRGSLGGMPGWARGIVFLFAVPGVVLIGLSLVAFCVSLLALLLLTVPVYQLLRWLTQSGMQGSAAAGQDAEGRGIVVNATTTVMDSPDDLANRPRRQVEVKIVE